MLRRWRSYLRSGLAAFVLAASAMACFAQRNAQSRPVMVPGEMLITVTRGTPRADVDAIASSVGGQVVRSFGAIGVGKTVDCYQLRLTAAIATVTDAQTLDAVTQVKTDTRVRSACPNYYRYPTQTTTATPNDTRYSEQWDLPMIKMPQAWTIEKGQSDVCIVVIDTGVDIDHEDLPKDRLLIANGGYNATTGSSDPRPTNTDSEAGHGTHVTGIAMASTNNSKGIAGVVWQNVKLLPINAADSSNMFQLATLVAALQFVDQERQANPSMKFVVNMSLGGEVTDANPSLSDLYADEQAIMGLAANGVVFSISAGNNGDSGNSPNSPARLAGLSSNILCVASVGDTGTQAYYSAYQDYVSIAAPGGDQESGRGILSTLPSNTYAEWQGTSMAAPVVTGAAALILSVPGVSASDVKTTIEATASPVTGAAVPSPKYGYGLLNVYAALLRVGLRVSVTEPEGTGGNASSTSSTPAPVETMRPDIIVHVSQILQDNLSISVDGTAVPQSDWTIQNVTVTNTPSGSTTAVPVVYDVALLGKLLSPGSHVVDVTGTKAGRTVTDSLRFTIAPKQLKNGRSLITIPYYQAQDANGNALAAGQVLPYYLGSGFRAARYVPDQQLYAFQTSTSMDSGFLPSSSYAPHADGSTSATYPVGVAFWSDLPSTTAVLTRGAPMSSASVVIPLKGTGTGTGRTISWNMIGDPFPFDVPYNSLLVDTPAGRMSIANAVLAGYLSGNLYSYDGDQGYTFRTLPDGTLSAWTGYWVGVTSSADISLVVPPLKVSSRAAAVTRSAKGTDGWLLKIGASAGTLRDTYNFIGVSSKASDGVDTRDVAKPPMPSPYLSCGIDNSGWTRSAGLYAQDIRSETATNTWPMVVTTDQANQDVTVSWAPVGTLPRNVKLVIKDEVSGQSIDMRTRSCTTFKSSDAGTTRKFTITSKPVVGTALRVSNMAVRTSGSRASGAANISFTISADASYDVNVLSASGKVMATVGSRAASAGSVRLVWNGRDSSGRSLPAGTYLVQVRARTSDGEAVRVIQPFALVR